MNTATPLNRLNTAAERHLARRADRWRRRATGVAASLPGWRTERRTRLLIRIYLGSLIVGLAIGVAQIFWPPALTAWVPFTLVMVISWSMLRTVINIRDSAPEEELDEYEREILRNWQAIAYGWLVLLALAAAAYMIILGSLAGGDLTHRIYTGGLFTVLVLLLTGALPTIAYATTFGPVPTPGTAPASAPGPAPQE